MKRISYIIAVIILLSSFLTVYAGDNNASTVKPDNMVVTLEEILAQIEKGNPEIILMDKKIDLLTKQYDEAVIRAKSFPHQASEKMNKLDIVKEERLNWKNKLLERNNMKHDRDDKLKQIKFSVEKMFADITILQVQEKSLSDQLSVIDKRMEQTKLKIKLGLLKSTDIKQLESQKIKLESELKGLQRQITISLSDLKKLTGISVATIITIKDYSYIYKAFDEKQLDERIQGAVENSYDISKAKEELELLKLERDIAYHFADDPQLEVEQLDIDISNKEAELNDLNTSVDTNIRVSYLSLQNLYDSIEIARIEKEIAEIDLKKAEVQFAVGKLIEMNVLESRIESIKMNAQLMQAITDYMNAAQVLADKLQITTVIKDK
jgi:outer membrane protein TolC